MKEKLYYRAFVLYYFLNLLEILHWQITVAVSDARRQIR